MEKRIGNDKTAIAALRLSAVGVYVLAGGLLLAFSVVGLSAEATASAVLFTVAGGLFLCGAGYALTAVLFAQKGDLRFVPWIGLPHALAFLVAMIGGILQRGQYTLTVEIVFFAFAAVEDSALALTVFDKISVKKSTVVAVGLAAISAVLMFVPLFVGHMTALAALREYAPYVLALIAAALFVVAEALELQRERKE